MSTWKKHPHVRSGEQLTRGERADQIAGELALHTYQIDKENLELTRMIHELTREVKRLTTAVYRQVGAASSDEDPTSGTSAVSS